MKELLQRKKESGLTVPVNYASEKAELKRRILGAEAAEKFEDSERWGGQDLFTHVVCYFDPREPHTLCTYSHFGMVSTGRKH